MKVKLVNNDTTINYHSLYNFIEKKTSNEKAWGGRGGSLSVSIF